MSKKLITKAETVESAVSITLPMPLVRTVYDATRHALQVDAIPDGREKSARDLVAYLELRFPELKGNA